MRQIVLSKTYDAEDLTLLSQGLPCFGVSAVRAKRDLADSVIADFLVYFPIRKIDPAVGICAFPGSCNPLVLLHNHAGAELRVHLVTSRHADRAKVDPSTVNW